MIEDHFSDGPECIQNFHNGEIYLIRENFIRENFRWGKFSSHGQYFATFLRREFFTQI